MKRIARSILIPATILALTPGVLWAQGQQPQLPQAPQSVVPVPVIPDGIDAQTTRSRWHQLLRQHPPNVGEVLQRDPSLLTRSDYLAPYPALLAFLQQHP